MKKKAAVVGATGYVGVELVRLLMRHPNIELCGVSSVSYEGKMLSEVYPQLKGICDMECQSQLRAIASADIVFSALPHGFSQDLAEVCFYTNRLFVDMGADFRLDDSREYAQWYGEGFKNEELNSIAVYGIPELFREQVRYARIIANPGCYPTCAGLGLFPAVQHGLISMDSIIIDAKSGTTGAGREPSPEQHFANRNESFSPYKVAQHRHTPEIEQTLSRAMGRKLKVTFVPHLLPVNRGIVCTMYANVKLGMTEERIRSAYEKFYLSEKFVRVLPAGATADLKNVRMSNYCDISLHVDSHRATLIVVSAIDNMIKGAAGQAIQNMNIIMGFDEDAGIDMIPIAF